MLEQLLGVVSRPAWQRAANAARDVHNWPEAARLYAQVLAVAPQLAPIWVQYGHALKESGRLAEAQTAYERAIAIDAGIADFHLQLGHCLKLRGNWGGAEAAYHEAHRLDPELDPATRELIALGAFGSPDTVERPVREACVAIDLSDAFAYLRHHDTVSGIQRVQLGIAKSLVAKVPSASREVRFIVDGGPAQSYLEVRAGILAKLEAELSREQVDHERLKTIIKDEERRSAQFFPQPGDVLVVLGAFWCIPTAGARFMSVKRSGARLVVLIHDIIPLTRPEFCEAVVANTFGALCPQVLQISDLILTVSDHTGREVASFIEARNWAAPPIETLKLVRESWRASSGDTSRALTLGQAPRASRLKPRSYVLFVSTIEVRKNHALLLKVWKQLIQTHGAGRVPKLVFVGRPGWRVEGLMEELKRTGGFGGAVIMMSGLSDAELSKLYRECLFSAFPSLEEGWGLPVGESLAYGRPCIASNAASIPEVGGDFVVYHDPEDAKAAIAIFEKMIFDEVYREGLAKRIREDFVARGWDEVTDDFVDLLEKHVPGGSETPRRALPAPMLAPGKLHMVGHENDMSAYLSTGIGEFVHYIFDEHWHQIEDFGRWMAGRSASIQIGVRTGNGATLVVVLVLDCPPWADPELALRLAVNGQEFEPIRSQGQRTFRVACRTTCMDSWLTIGLKAAGPILSAEGDGRQLTFGIRALGYYDADSLAERLQMIEELTFLSGGVSMLRPRSDWEA